MMTTCFAVAEVNKPSRRRLEISKLRGPLTGNFISYANRNSMFFQFRPKTILYFELLASEYPLYLLLS